MVSRVLTAALAVAAFAGPVFAQKGTRESKCPADSPCCQLYGDCGVGAFCLGGCDPTMSHTMDSCVPGPVCKSGEYKLNSLDDIQSIDSYLGDASKYNWQSQGTPKKYNDQGLLLTMSEDSSGTLLASTFYVWYGKICTKMRTSQGRGVVTAFIMMSDVKDEIDFEFIGTDIHAAQSNFYAQGVTNYKNSENLTVTPDTLSKTHEYCIDWQPDTLTWSIDGNEMRSVKREDTWNASAGYFSYPQTPSRVMLSLWPAGKAGNAKGTIDWAGGEIDWNSQYMQKGYYYALVESVNVDCHDPPDGVKKSGSKTYKYTDEKMPTNNTVEITDDVVVLGSLMGTGDEPGEASKSSTGPAPSKTVNMVPGGNPGGGARQETTAATTGSQAATTGSSGSSGGSGGDDFVQGNNNNGGSSSGSLIEPGLGRIGGSALAIVVAILGLLVL